MKKKISISIKTEHYALLKLLNIKFGSPASATVDVLLSNYYSKVVERLSPTEKEALSNIKNIVDDSLFKGEELVNVSKQALDEIANQKLMVVLNDEQKRKKLRELLK